MNATSAPLIISIVLFLISLTQKCYCTTGNCSDSIMVLLIGWLGAFSGGAAITWFANPALLVSWLTFTKSANTSLIASFIASFFAVIFLMFGTITANESGQDQPIIAYRAGYWLWLASSVVMLVANLYRSANVMKGVNPMQ